MRMWTISTRGIPAVEVRAYNWLVALGEALGRLGAVDDVARLACEVLPNGTVIARDATSGRGFVVMPTTESPAPERASTPDAPDLPGAIAAISEADTQADACKAALVVAAGVAPAESGAVILADGDELRFAAASGPRAAVVRDVRFPLGSGIVGVAMTQRRAIVVDDAGVDPRHFGDVDRTTSYRTHTLACLPLMVDDRVFGVLELLNLPTGTTFSRASLRDLQLVADALAARLATERSPAG